MHFSSEQLLPYCYIHDAMMQQSPGILLTIIEDNLEVTVKALRAFAMLLCVAVPHSSCRHCGCGNSWPLTVLASACLTLGVVCSS